MWKLWVWYYVSCFVFEKSPDLLLGGKTDLIVSQITKVRIQKLWNHFFMLWLANPIDPRISGILEKDFNLDFSQNSLGEDLDFLFGFEISWILICS